MASSIENLADVATEQEELALANQVTKIGIGVPPNLTNVCTHTEGSWASKEANGHDNSESPADHLSLTEKNISQQFLRSRLLGCSKEIKHSNRRNETYFDDLNLKPELLKGITKMGLYRLSSIQESVLPLLLSATAENVVAVSEFGFTGTGRTVAFVLAMLNRVNPNLKCPQVLCLQPTYELALHIGNVVKAMCQFCPDITIAYAVRGVEIEQDVKLAQQIIIGTPGKVMDWAFRFRYFKMSTISLFVLDEADVMFTTDRYHDQCIKIHKRLSKNCQIMLFSATYDECVVDFVERIVPSANMFRFGHEERLKNIKQYYIKCNTDVDKYKAISNIYAVITVGQGVIFCDTRKTSAWLAAKLTKEGHAVALLTEELTAQQRMAVLNRFRDCVEKVLITTNILDRGIDIERVTLVLNYDVPLDSNHRPDYGIYFQRIRHTGPFGKFRLAINLVHSRKTMDALNEIGLYFGKEILLLDADNVDELEQLEN